MRPIVSLSQPVSSDDSLNIEDRIASFSFADEKIESIALQQAITLLDPTERAIVEMRFFAELRQVQVAERLGISQPQVSKIEKSALKRLRQELDVM